MGSGEFKKAGFIRWINLQKWPKVRKLRRKGANRWVAEPRLASYCLAHV
jgi:hypothetical protein